MTKELTIDPELRDLLPPLTDDEKQHLRESLLAEGRALIPIFTWANHEDTIIDGYNRHELCLELGLPFETRALKLDSKADVIAWIIKHQAGRRNLTPVQRRELLGKLYNETKKESPGQPKKNGDIGDAISQPGRTREKVAATQGVTPKTVERAGQLATDLESVPKEAKDKILTEQIKSSDKAVHDLAALPAKKREKASKLIAEGKVVSVKEAVQQATGEKPKPTATTSRAAQVKKATQALGSLVRALDALKVLELHRTDLNKIESRLKGIK